MPEPQEDVEEEGSIRETLATWRTRGLLSLMALALSSFAIFLVSTEGPFHRFSPQLGKLVVIVWMAMVQAALFCTLAWAGAWKFERDARLGRDDD